MMKELFLTYEGLLHVLFASHNNKTKSFRKWATETLFTAQMGTKEQKQKLSCKLLGTDADVIKEVFSRDANTLPCVYLFTLGTVKNLRKTMNIDAKHKDDDIVCKYGFTKNLSRRTGEHQKTYGKLNNVNLKLKYYSYMDPQYMSDGENKIKKCMTTLNTSLKYDDHNELIIMTKDNEEEIKDKYEYVSQKYSGHVSELITKIKDLEHKNIILEKNVETEKQNTKLVEKDLIILQKDNELLQLQLANAK